MQARVFAGLGSLLLAGVAAFACDIEDTGHEQDVHGPKLRIVQTNVEGAGAEIAADGAIQIVFDRYLLPAVYKRQAFRLLNANRDPIGSDGMQTIYDPVALTVTITGALGYGTEWLTPGQTYYLTLPVADDARDTVEDLSGFRSIDREPLAERHDYIFRAVARAPVADAGPIDDGPSDGGTGGGTSARRTRIDPTVTFCADILPLFVAKCANAICHSAKGAASGLILDSAEGIRETAIDRVAHGSNTARQGITAESDTRLFGINMPIITPGDPGASWLVYKVELAPDTAPDLAAPNIACTPPRGAPPVSAKSTENAAFVDDVIKRFAEDGFKTRDRTVLANHVTGREMPYPYPAPAYLEADPYKYTPLTFQERQRIRIWIADRAPTSDCGGCGVVEDAVPNP